MEQPVRLLIVDDHPALRFGLDMLLSHSSEIVIVGEAGDGIDAIEKANELKPDVILMDIALPKKNGLDAMREILATNPETKILIFSAYSDGEQIYAAIKAGAFGYLVKDSSSQILIAAIMKAHHGQPAFSREIELNLIHQIQHGQTPDFPAEKLTDREIEILRWLANGLTNSQIAEKAKISEGTVRSHVSNLLHKLELENRAQAVIYAHKKGLIIINPE